MSSSTAAAPRTGTAPAAKIARIVRTGLAKQKPSARPTTSNKSNKPNPFVVYCPRCGGRLFLESDISDRGNSHYWGCVNCSREYEIDGHAVRRHVIHKRDTETGEIVVSNPRLPVFIPV